MSLTASVVDERRRSWRIAEDFDLLAEVDGQRNAVECSRYGADVDGMRVDGGNRSVVNTQ